MISEEQQRLIYDVINTLVQTQGLELVEVKIGIHQKDVFLQVLADKIPGGISIAECSCLNHSIVEAIDKKGILSEDGYSLEVSSPGLDRPLVTKKDFLRNINSEIHLWLNDQLEGKKEYVGVITSASEDNLTVLTTKEKKEIIVPIAKVIKGLLVI